MVSNKCSQLLVAAKWRDIVIHAVITVVLVLLWRLVLWATLVGHIVYETSVIILVLWLTLVWVLAKTVIMLPLPLLLTLRTV